MKGIASFWKYLPCFSFSHHKAHVLSSFLSSSLSHLNSFPPRYVWNPHGALWWPGSSASIYLMLYRTIVSVEVLFMIHLFRDSFHIFLHICISWNFWFIFFFFWQALFFFLFVCLFGLVLFCFVLFFSLDSETWNISWQDSIYLMGGSIHTHIIGTTLTSNMQSSTFFCFYCFSFPAGNFC